jgi:dTDP-4-amino-4,6-dideoxygalactose transaminase
MKKSSTNPLVTPFNRPRFAQKEREYLNDVLRSGHTSGDGAYTRKCERFFEEQLKIPRSLLTTSCTDALEMCALLLKIGPSDEVIVPSFTFVSTANAFVLRGAKLVFADIRPDTLNIDEKRLEALISKRTRAIVAVHYAGVGCEMDSITTIARRYKIAVVEDNAHGLFGSYRGNALGTFGCLATQSFHETKNITCGEGGALLINDSCLVERAEILREKGTNRAKFFRGEVDKYSWVDFGSSFLPSELNAAVLWAQLQRSQGIQKERKRIWETYYHRLQEWASESGVSLPHVPAHVSQPWHMFYMLFNNLEERTRFLAAMRGAGIGAVFHYLPLHKSKMGVLYAARKTSCPIAEDISDRLVRLPLYNGLARRTQDAVVTAVLNYKTSHYSEAKETVA